MDSARQVVRWSIPGFVLVFELAVFAAAFRLVEGADPLGVIAAVDTTAAVLGLLAGVPMGFLLYQLYFRNYRPFGYSALLIARRPWALPAGLVRGLVEQRGWHDVLRHAVQRYAFIRTDRGAVILDEYLRRGGRRELIAHVWPDEAPSTRAVRVSISPASEKEPVLGGFMPNSFFVLKLVAGPHEACQVTWDATICRDCRTTYRETFIRHWSIVVAMLDFTSGFQNAVAIKNEYTSGSDIYHALGAARTGIVSAWYLSLGYFLAVARPDHSWLAVVLGALLVSVLAFMQYKVLSSARNQVFTSLAARTAAGLAWFSRTDWPARTDLTPAS